MSASPIAVCLLTCGRLEYTKRTVESFAAHNDLTQFQLLHADDASDDPAIDAVVAAHGFQTVLRMPERLGWRITRHALIAIAAKRADWILLLENDIESQRAFPWSLFHFMQTLRGVDGLRLYGAFKGPGQTQPCLTIHKRTKAPVAWRALDNAPEPAEIGSVHWSAQPAVTRSAAVLALHARGTEPRGLTVRVVNNVMVHIGAVRTAPQVATC